MAKHVLFDRYRLARAASDSISILAAAALHQLAFGEEPLSHARGKHLGAIVFAPFYPSHFSRPADRWVLSAARLAASFGTVVPVDARAPAPSQTPVGAGAPKN